MALLHDCIFTYNYLLYVYFKSIFASCKNSGVLFLVQRFYSVYTILLLYYNVRRIASLSYSLPYRLRPYSSGIASASFTLYYSGIVFVHQLPDRHNVCRYFERLVSEKNYIINTLINITVMNVNKTKNCTNKLTFCHNCFY